MPRSRWGESIKSLGSSHIDPEKDEQLKMTKIEIENKVAKIMKLIKKKNQAKRDGNSATDLELNELIDDFHKQYQSLYELYSNLREEVREKVHGKENKEGSSSTSSSDTESYHSVDEASARSSPRNKFNSIIEEKEALHTGYMASPSNVKESEKMIKELMTEGEETEITKQKLMKECGQLKEKLVEREKELFSLSRAAHQVNESKVPTQIKELEREVSTLKLENKNLCTRKKELEEKVKGRAKEAKQLGEENSGLQSRILELEMTSKEKEHTLSALRRKLEENESNSMSKIEDLMARTNNLQLEVDTLRTQKGELEEQVLFKSNEASVEVNGVMDQINVLQQELHSLTSQKSESESSVEKVTQEISHFLIQIENLKKKLESKTMDLQRMLEEKAGLERQVKNLELEAGSLRSKKSELEEQMRSKNYEADQLSEEKEGLHVRIYQLEKSLKERIDELSALQMKFENFGNDSSSQIKALVAELESLRGEKTQLELKIEREKQGLMERLTWMEKQNIELTSKTVEHQTTMKGQEAIINKLNDEHKQVRDRYLESMLNLQIAERKIEETAEEFRKKFEDSLRILSRRIRVAEQLHVENKDVYRKTKETYEKQQTDLKERVATSAIAVKKMKEISLTANDILTGLDAVALKFEECSGNFLNRISKTSCEVLFVKDWVRRKNNAIKHVQEDVDCLLSQLDTKEAEILGLREKVWKLENTVRELKKMVKEKEEGMLGMKEEKREAIRQLCVWIDYHRSRSDYLKKILSDMIAVRSQRTP
ncbi:COP1-interactive protein 1 [Camellia lanceoleosa]|uniref:COP1-interactive protein 1 n=1 Tax=Camellia lanceoleosa TaxID=1840588 RepID=A0ACC0FHJ1_9ERIC|nr:COP1-interactive protein 1 [Camellia lanceoleosa]